MTRTDYDVVIVGARCAGAALAAFLSRKGARVLLLDADAMPSDHVVSTHSINPLGMDVLDELGVGDAVRAVTPSSRIIRSVIDGTSADLVLSEGRAVYCARRERLDGLLQNAAVSAGAVMMDRARVTSLIRSGGRVCGVRATCGDREHAFTAALVVGADGRRSTVARHVEAEEYLGYDAPRACFWGYWPAPAMWKSDAAYGFDAYFSNVTDVMRVIFQTDDDQLVIASSPPVDHAGAWRADPSGMLETVLGADPLIRALVQSAPRIGKVRGTIKERFYFRRAAGAGWALVGDAGHHKDFSVGDGISEALRQAKGLAAAIGSDTDAALARWWRQRDVDALPMYFLGREAGSVDPPVELQRIVFECLNTVPGLKQRLVDAIDGQISPLEILSARILFPAVLAAAARGRTGALEELWSAAGRGIAMTRELRLRARLLAAADACLAREDRAAA